MYLPTFLLLIAYTRGFYGLMYSQAHLHAVKV